MTNQMLNLKRVSLLLVVVVLGLCGFSSFSSAIAYAPLTIYGHVSLAGDPVIGAQVSIHVFENQSSSFSEETFTNENGDFIFVLTLKDSSSVDVQISTKTTETYVDVIEDALPWNTYSLDMRLEENAPAEVHISSSARNTSEFDADMEKIISGELIDNPVLVDEFKEKYGMEVVPLDEERSQTGEAEAKSSSLESPAFIPAPDEDMRSKGVQRSFLEILALLVIVMCIFLIRHEIKHES